jgi:hypothetical protein
VTEWEHDELSKNQKVPNDDVAAELLATEKTKTRTKNALTDRYATVWVLRHRGDLVRTGEEAWL